MTNFPDNAAYEAIRDELFELQARRAFEGIMSMLWFTHDVSRIRAMLMEQIEYCDSVVDESLRVIDG